MLPRVALLLSALLPTAASSTLPHILLLLIDDYAWNSAGWHHTPGDPGSEEVRTPHMDALVAEGIELDRQYVYQFCSPSRAALQSGRNPVHVNLYNQKIARWNPHNANVSGMGLPRAMTTVAQKLKLAGYATHQRGKWGISCQSPGHIPTGRGYDTSFGYFDHTLDYWTERAYEQCPTFQTTDLWASNAPAYGRNGSFTCTQANQAGCPYLDAMITDSVSETIAAHDPSTPMFMFWAPHATHSPLEVPEVYFDRFPIPNSTVNPQLRFRRIYDALTNFIDEAVGNVTALLRAKGMYNNTLIVMLGDNGAPITPSSGAGRGANGANSYPLRGGKVSNWEGGIRANAFVSGGFLPPSVRGTKSEALIGIEDWMPTLCAIAGVDPTDDIAAAAGLPPVDGVNVWPFLSRTNSTPPRAEFLIGAPFPIPGVGHGMSNGTVQGLIQPPWKYVEGNMSIPVWLGPLYPNATTNWDESIELDCGMPGAPGADGTEGCLFDIFADPEERNNVAAANPHVVTRLQDRVRAARVTVFDPDRGAVDEALACSVALKKWGGFWGPYTD